jgi:small subunit ribosomal protein S20
MPITRSAKKALRVSDRKKSINDRRKKTMKDSIKKIEKMVKAKDASVGKELGTAYAAIDKALKRGVIKKNTAARRKSLVARMVK